jgi:two-component sensor histidine kinase
MSGAADLGEITPAAYAMALGNILEDFGVEKLRLEDTQRAILNIADDGEAERVLLRESQRAVLNVLADLGAEKALLEETQIAVLRSEQTVRASLKEKEVLLKEIHHRVKNNMQVITSLLSLQAKVIKDEQARAVFQDSQNRVKSMALIHETLYRSHDLSRINFDEYLKKLVAHVSRSYRTRPEAVKIRINVEDVLLPIDTAVPCGLIINELASNSLKYAFPGDSSGDLEITFARKGAEYVLRVSDTGVGLPAGFDPDAGESLGLKLVRTLTSQIGGELECRNGKGATFQITFPDGEAQQ